MTRPHLLYSPREPRQILRCNLWPNRSRIWIRPRNSGELNVVIDTPKGSRNKFSWDEKRALFELFGVLPADAVFPYDFGFLPNTRGGDGAPLDVLVLMDEPAFSGCLVGA